MPELFRDFLRLGNALTQEQAWAVDELHELAIEENPVCQQAPNIWDADTQTDANLAKKNCHGLTAEGNRFGDACPIMKECLETALKLETKYGVWGGMTPRERSRLLKRMSR